MRGKKGQRPMDHGWRKPCLTAFRGLNGFTRIKKIQFVFLILLLWSTGLFAQIIELPDKWLFRTGDDSSYKEISIDDSAWDSIYIPAAWEEEGYEGYDGIAWYRVSFPTAKELLNKELYLLAGTIDDVDHTYLNGKLIGSTGKLPPNEESAWNRQRIYKIPSSLLKENNVLAIRVYDGRSGGGLYGGTVGIFNKEGYIDELDLEAPPKKSFYQLVTSNGLIAAVYNEKRNAIEYVLPHIFQMFDESKRVKPFIRNLELNISEKPLKISYLENTHVIELKYKNFRVSYFAPFSTDQKIFYAAAEGDTSVIDLNYKFEKTYCEVLKEEKLLQHNGKYIKYFLFSFNDSLHNNANRIKSATQNLSSNFVSKEVEYMKSVFKRASKPERLTEDERNLYEQSISILKMAQVSDSEIFDRSKGQVLASLPPGNWNITWVRDGMYAILALSRAGLLNEAKRALMFYLNADAGYYKNYTFRDSLDHGVKSDYLISVCRYFGMGKEESDFNENGPNIELDGFGSFLVVFSDYVNKSNDVSLLKEYHKILEEKVALPLINSIDTNNLIRRESGPWEEHLPGKQFTFTSSTASAGLKAFADICNQHNIYVGQRLLTASKDLLSALKSNIVYDDKMLKGFREAKAPESISFFDGGTFEFFNMGLNDNPELFTTHLNNYKKRIRINEQRGFSRLNNPDWYTIAEWPFINLRIASACLKYNNRAFAKEMIDWTTIQSKLNFNMIAELYDYETCNYGGAIPMVGFGAGAYRIALNDYYSINK